MRTFLLMLIVVLLVVLWTGAAPLPKPTTEPLPIVICAVYPGTTRLIASCGPDPYNPPVPCMHPDGSIIMKHGTQLQFGILAPDGLHCTVSK